ncbi:MAG: hypothetical protein R2770_02890 [Acidimicrobiales bacterium]
MGSEWAGEQEVFGAPGALNGVGIEGTPRDEQHEQAPIAEDPSRADHEAKVGVGPPIVHSHPQLHCAQPRGSRCNVS